MICGSAAVITTHKWTIDCNIMIFTETWLNNDVPDNTINLMWALCPLSRPNSCWQTRGGGLCIYFTKPWCTDTTIIGSHCSSNLKYLMVKWRHFYLPRVFTSTVVTAASIPPDANAKIAMKELHTAISKQQTLHPQVAYLVVGDFNHSNLKTVLPKFHQHVSCPTRGETNL